MPETDILIIGSGVAGLAVASKATSKNITIITKQSARQSNSMLAQGGIAAAMSSGDCWEDHFEDTMTAGCDLNNPDAVKLMVQTGPVYVNEWITKGFPIDRDGFNKIRLGKEGAHRKRRILHAGGDQTGKILTETMLEKMPKNVQILENTTAVDLLLEDGICRGAMVRNEQGETFPYYAGSVVLATGGIGGLYETNSNNTTISGDGLAMAYRAGCRLKDLEFVQFHPTLLYVDGQGRGLISEAVRGEGAKLVTASGQPIMEGVHPMKDLAPRDVVARTLFSYLLQGEDIFLDVSMIGNFSERFPAITQLCKDNGIDPEAGKIPVAPGAHFHMGGIRTDKSSKTNVENLYAVGEAACQGVHGANRLASNSLLEGLVFGSRLGEFLDKKVPEVKSVSTFQKMGRPAASLPSPKEIQHVMTEKVGIVRTPERLEAAIRWFEGFGVSDGNVDVTGLSDEQLHVWNMLTAGWLIASAALKRSDSVGAHYMEEHK